MNEIEKLFSDWFHEQENYGTRSERFYEDASIQDSFRRDVILTKWLYTAFQLGYEANKKENNE